MQKKDECCKKYAQFYDFQYQHLVYQAVETPDEEERLSASVTAVVADHCYTTSPTTATTSTNSCYSTSTTGDNQSYASQTPKQNARHRVHSRFHTIIKCAIDALNVIILIIILIMMMMLIQDRVQRCLSFLL